MELLLQALDELDDLIATMRQLWLRYRWAPRHPRRAPAMLRVAASRGA